MSAEPSPAHRHAARNPAKPGARRARGPRRGAAVPRYREVASALLADIADGRYALGDFLPTEAELCVAHAISRFTARAALRQLAEAGLVLRRQGSGTQVIGRAGEARFTQQVGNVAALTQYARTTWLSITSKGRAALTRMQALEFDARAGEEWLTASGVRFDRAGGREQPICATRIYFNPILAGILEHVHDTDGPLYEIVEREFGVTISRVEQHISAVSLDRHDAATLNERSGRPALRTLRLYYDAASRLLEVSENIHPGDRFAYSMQLQREP
ncbi:MAG: GntR family transcriptional regulator [Burkholderiales bacterium]